MSFPMLRVRPRATVALHAIMVTAFALAVACGRGATTSYEQFYSGDSTPVHITYRTHFTIPLSEFRGTVKSNGDGQITLTAGQQARLDEVLRLHLRHLYGVFTYHTAPTDFTKTSGSIRENYIDAGTRITSLAIAKDKMIVRYTYHDDAVFHESFMGSAAEKKVRFLMPIEPTTIYALGFPEVPVPDPETGEPMNTCTSDHDNSEAAFWYYWNPDQPDCPKAVKQATQIVEATLTPQSMTRSTYPEYASLYATRDLRVHVMFGLDETMDNPVDLGRLAYNEFIADLSGLRRTDGKPTLRPARSASAPFENKRFVYATDQFDAMIQVSFVDSDAEGWEAFAADVLTTGSVVLYSGHSNEGWDFSPERLFPDSTKSLPKNKYQVISFNACSTWSYFATNYFELKKDPDTDPNGTRNLEVLTNGIGAPFVLEPDHPTDPRPSPDMILLTSLLGLNIKGHPAKSLVSWQTIMNDIARATGRVNSALMNVLGDEDNPTSAPAGISVPTPIK